MGDRLRFNRVGYFSNVNSMSVQYANGAKNKPADFSYDKLMDMNAMQAFLDDRNTALTEDMNQKFGDIFESVKYDVRIFSDRLSPHLQIITKDVLSRDIKGPCEEYLESYQKKFAKEFNKQPFTQTEYGFAKFPSTNKFGIDLHHDNALVSNQKLSIAGSDDDKYKEIIAAPSFMGDCNYHFKFDENKWPTVDTSLYYNKDGTMKESNEPVMTGVKAVLEKQGLFDSVCEIRIYSDQCVVVTMPPIDESAIISIADGLGEYGMGTKIEQDGNALEAALATIQTSSKDTEMGI